MANGVLASLNRILESQERREQTKLQTSLAMMEMSQRRRMQDFEMVTKQLEQGTNVNKELRLKVVNNFLNKSGFNSLIGIDYTTPKDDRDPPDLNKAVKDLTRAEWGKFSESDAQRIVTAVWTHRASQDPTEVIEIMSDLRNQMDSGEGELFKAYQRGSGKGKNLIGYKGIDDDVWQAQESLRIGENIFQERREVSEGDFKIDLDLGLAEEQIAPTLPEGVSLTGDVSGISDQSKYQEVIIDDIRDKNEQIVAKQRAKRTAEILEQEILDKIKLGTASDKEKEQLLKIPSIQDEFDEDIRVLQSGIAQVKSSADVLAEMEIRELVRQVGKKSFQYPSGVGAAGDFRPSEPRYGEKILASLTKEGTFDLLEQLPDELVASIVAGDKKDVKDRLGTWASRNYIDDTGTRKYISEKQYRKLVELSDIVSRSRALEAGEVGTGLVKSIDLPYVSPPPAPVVAPTEQPLLIPNIYFKGQTPIDDPDDFEFPVKQGIPFAPKLGQPGFTAVPSVYQPSPDPTTGMLPDPITSALNALLVPQSLGLPPPIK
tara:strand:+ start:448 stop:2079 length:1632 start_codon:yes stop_codon:yes gene_type:complete